MRKAKVAAAFMCLFCSGMLGGVTFTGNELSVAKADQSDQILELTDIAVTSTTSIETTTLVSTTTTTTKKTKPKSKSTTTSTTTQTTTTTTTTTSTSATETTTTNEQTTTDFVETTSEPVTTITEAPVTTTVTVTEAPLETTVPETTVILPENTNSPAISVTEREYIMLCNVVGHEYGADWVPVEEKALVCEVIMNRVNSPQFPNTIYGVLTQHNQFAGLEYLIELDYMSHYVTQSVRDAVDMYLSDPTQFAHGYLYFNGDGYRNYFRTTY